MNLYTVNGRFSNPAKINFGNINPTKAIETKNVEDTYTFVQSEPVMKKTETASEKLMQSLDSLANTGRAQICSRDIILSPDIQHLKQLTDKFSLSDLQISQTKENIIKYLKKISSNLENIAISTENNGIDDVFAKKAVIDYLAEHINYNNDYSKGPIGFEFGLPTKKIDKYLTGFQEEFNKSVSYFKKEGILTASDYDFKSYQFDAEDIMKRDERKTHETNQSKYNELFDPITRLRGYFDNDPYLDKNANFYRIISPSELKSLAQTKHTKAYIDSNGYYTDGHYSCITTNPDYNEQDFAANGLPIRLKFKTKDSDGLYNMDLLNRIGGLKQERSIYRIFGYNFYDIDWDNVCVDIGNGWEQLSRDYIEEIISKLSN